MQSDIRPIDQARAASLIMASMTGDPLMFSATFQEIVDDHYGLGEMGSLINVLRTLSDDLAGAIVDTHGEEAGPDLVRAIVVQFRQAADEQLADEGN